MDSDVIIIATGSKPKTLLGYSSKNIHYAQDVITGKYEIHKEAIIIGGGMVGCELALELAEQGKKVAIVEISDSVLKECEMPIMNKKMLLDMLKSNNVEIITDAKIEAITDEAIRYSIKGKDYEKKTKNIINAIGYRAENALYQQLIGIDRLVYVVGDAKRVKNVMYAIWDAYEICNGI